LKNPVVLERFVMKKIKMCSADTTMPNKLTIETIFRGK
jgi:hypothetical protein